MSKLIGEDITLFVFKSSALEDAIEDGLNASAKGQSILIVYSLAHAAILEKIIGTNFVGKLTAERYYQIDSADIIPKKDLEHIDLDLRKSLYSPEEIQAELTKVIQAGASIDDTENLVKKLNESIEKKEGYVLSTVQAQTLCLIQEDGWCRPGTMYTGRKRTAEIFQEMGLAEMHDFSEWHGPGAQNYFCKLTKEGAEIKAEILKRLREYKERTS